MCKLWLFCHVHGRIVEKVDIVEGENYVFKDLLQVYIIGQGNSFLDSFPERKGLISGEVSPTAVS